ncbi:hypothetical protein GCM10009789_12730 [Kribbella sancticallisti]|uniref:DUF4190 domain-containing protein n=1 Tax=Kribbella sancticallisti TaxID=460087 RepID=A0ABN2CM48_9ACTN
MSFDERPQDATGRPGEPGYPQYGGRPQDPGYSQQPGYSQEPGYSQQPGYSQYGGGPEPTRYPLQPGYAYQQPAYGIARDNSTATLALVLGVVGLAAGLLIVSPFAWWQGNKALTEIDAAPGVYRNRGMAQAGQITGIIGTILLGLGILFAIAMVVFVVALNRSY